MAKRRGSTKSKAVAAAAPEVSDAESSEWEIDQPKTQQQNATKARKPRARVLKKDSDEEDLERLVLGDRAGFRAQLFGAVTVEDAGQSLNELSLVVAGGKPGGEGEGEDAADDGEDDERDEFEDADDAHMFLYDDTLEPNTALAAADATTASAGGKDGRTRDEGPVAAWEDSDDERLSVSLAGQNRLRKLRRTQGEDIVNGAEYAARLRQQFLRLNPQPAWAVEAIKARQKLDDRLEGRQAAKKKRKTKRRASGHGSGAEASDASDESLFSDSDSDDANVDEDKDAEDDGAIDSAALPLDKFFRSAGALASASQLLAQHHGAKKRRLRPEVLDIQKTRDVATVHTGPVTSLSFHPQYAVLLSASMSCTLHLHQLAPTAHPTPNPLLTAVRVRHTPVHRAAFVAAPVEDEGDDQAPQPQIVFAGRRRFFHTWDLATGRVQRITGVQGHRLEQRSMERFRASPTGAHLALVASDRKGGGMLNILSVQTMQWVAQARLDSRGGIADFQWWRDGAGITLLGRDGRVGEWSLAARRFVGTWRDDGSTGGTVLGLGGRQGPAALGGDRWVAIGSSSGITNLYDRTTLLEAATTATAAAAAAAATSGAPPPTLVAHPTPMRVFEQLTTPVTEVVFAPDGQLLAFASRLKRDALRLAHLPTGTVYRNWPTAQTPLGRITAVAFNRESNILAVGNDVGKTRLWEIRG